MIGGANRWTDFVKQWASDHDVTYTCAISLPECKKEYYEMIGKTPKPAKPKAPPKESASPWVQFVREWAKKKGVSYSCAVAMPECGEEYRKKTGAKANPKTLASQAQRKASKQSKVRGRTAVSLAEMGKSAKAKVAKAEATITKAVATAVKKRRGRPPKVAEPELEYETNYTPPATPKGKKKMGPPSGPPPLSPEQVAEAKKSIKRERMAQLRAERKAKGMSSSGKTFTKPKGSAPAISFEILEEAYPTEAKKGFSKATVDEIKASLIRRAEEAKTPPQVAVATPTLVPPAPPKGKKATKASKAVDSKDAQRLVQDTFNVMLSEEGDVDDGDWLRERGFPVPSQGLVGLNDNFVWFYTSPIAQREMEDAITRAIALAKSTYGADVSRDSIIGYDSGMVKGHQSYFYDYQPDWMTAERPVLGFVNAPKAKASKVKADFPTSMSAYARWSQERPKEVREVLYQHERMFNYGDKDAVKGAIKWLRTMASGRTNEELDALILSQWKGDNWRSTSTLARAMRGEDFSDEWVKSKAEADRLEKIKKDKEEEERQERWNQMIAEQTAKWKGRAMFVPPKSRYDIGYFQFLKPDKFGAFWCFTPKSDYYFGVVKPGYREGTPLLFKFGEEELLGKGAVQYYESVKDKVSSDRRFGGSGDDKEIFWDLLKKSGSGLRRGGMFEDDEIIEESGPFERAKPTEQELMGREDRRREELAEREADNLFVDDDELVEDDDFLEGDEIIEQSGPYPRPRPSEQEMMGREDARTEELTNREADRLFGRGRGCAPCLQDYDMIIKHLLEHITDPNEPIDPKDYDHAIHFIKRIRRMKGGVLHLMRQRRTAVPLLGGVNEEEQERIEAEQLRNFSGDVKGQVRRRIADLYAYRQKMYGRSNKYAGHPTADAINHEIEQLEDFLESGRTPREPERPDGPRPPDLLSPFPLSDDFIASPRFEGQSNIKKYGRNIRDFAGKGWEEKPAKSGNVFLDTITTLGHEAGKAHPASKFVNPFDAGFKFGEKVVAPALMKTKLGNPKTGIFSKKFWTPKKKHH